MLTEPQISRVWQCKMEAEARSYYFAEIASRESTIKRWITGGTFFLSSATVVTILADHKYSSSFFALLIAIANGYQIAVGQDGKIKTAAKLQLGWIELEHDYDKLWSHVHDDNAEAILSNCLDRERELSETASTEIGYRPEDWRKWLDIVHKKYDTGLHDDIPN
jgi:hypothetical protein